MDIYAAAVKVEHVTPRLSQQAMLACVVLADSERDAREKALARAQRDFPPEDGWQRYDALVCEITPGMLAQLHE